MKTNNNTRKEEIFRKVETQYETFYISEERIFLKAKDRNSDGMKDVMKLKLEDGTTEEIYNLVHTNEFYAEYAGVI